jgi:PIN domain nuclease of toxin-antitoxin system
VTRLLLDTHYVMYLAGDQDRLSRAEKAVLDQVDQRLLVSAISIWEIRLKWHALNRFGQRKGPISPETALRVLKSRTDRFQLVPLRVEQPTCPPLDPPLTHGDPFDEMLLIQAEAEGAVLLSRDRKLAGHRLVMSL